MSQLTDKLSQIRYYAGFISIIFCFLLLACDLRYGLVESIFQLAPESRLPRWLNVSGYDRKNLSVTITIYSSPFGGDNTKIIIYGPSPERKKLMEKAGTERWHHLSKNDNDKKYPNYTIITVDGIEEVFEQRQPGNILYISDDPKVRSKLK